MAARDVQNNIYIIDTYKMKEKARIVLERIQSIRNEKSSEDDGNGDDEGDDGGSGDTSGNGAVGSFSDWQHQAENFINMGKNEEKITTNDAITALLPVGKLLVGIATIVLVIVGSIMGVKYMIAGANEKAQLKQKLIYYVISVVLVYGAVGIFSLVVGIMNSILA